MKKLITAALAMTMMFSSFARLAFADDNMEKIIVDVKNRAGITDEYTDFSSDYYEYKNGFAEYSLSWEMKDGDGYININYNSDGVITSYHKYYENKYSNGISMPKVSSDEAQKAAQEFVDKLNPSSKGEFVVIDSSISTALRDNYSFDIERLKNGVKVDGFYGNVEVDRSTAMPCSMSMSYSKIDKFEDISEIISGEDAKDAFKKKLGLELVYHSYRDDNKINVFPVYKEASANKYISAVTGEIFEPNISDEMYRGETQNAAGDMVSESSKYESDGGLSSVEIKELDKIAGLISKTDIEAKVRGNKTLNIPSDLKLASINLRRDYYDNEQYTYSMYFNSEKKFANVTADAKTGEIRSFDLHSESDDAKEKTLDENTVKANAEKIIGALAESKKSEYRFERTFGNNAVYYRYVNNTKVMDDTINVSFDGKGKLTGYYLSYTSNAQFPPIDDAMSADEAADKLFEASPYELSYILSSENKETVAKAVYMTNPNRLVNPFTGKLVDFRNEEITENAVYSYSDVDNHWAKKQIETLATYGVGFSGGEFMPDEYITQRDFLYLLLKTSFSYINDDNELYRVAERKKLVEKRDKNAKVTRSEMAKIMIRFMDAEEYAKLENIYVSPFKDVTENKGYAAILSAMGVVTGDENGNFNPQNTMTRAEAACVIYNYLDR